MTITPQTLTDARGAALLCANLACAVHAAIRSTKEHDIGEELRQLPAAVESCAKLLKENRLDAETAHAEALRLASEVAVTQMLFDGGWKAFLLRKPDPDYLALCKRIKAEQNAKLDWLATLPKADTAQADAIQRLTEKVETLVKREPEEQPEEVENRIHRNGDIWEIKYGNERGQYSNKCISQLAKILAQPRRTLAVADLIDDPERKIEGDAALCGENSVDAEAIHNIRKRLTEIDNLAEITGGSNTHEDEKEKLNSALSDATKQLTTPLGNAHHNIATQIRTLIRNKLKGDMPKLAEHLTVTLKMEKPHFVYSPTDPIRWEI